MQKQKQMQILHLDLKPVGEDYIELRFFVDNPNHYESRSLPLAEIAELLKKAEEGYYTYLHEDYAITGQKLYNWLDGSDRFLQRLIDKHWRKGIILAISTAKKLAHLPWEVLHDRNSFLVQRLPGISYFAFNFPVRLHGSGEQGAGRKRVLSSFSY